MGNKITKKDISDLEDVFFGMEDYDVEVRRYSPGDKDRALVLCMELIPGFIQKYPYKGNYQKFQQSLEKIKSEIFKDNLAIVEIQNPNPENKMEFSQICWVFKRRYLKYGDLDCLMTKEFNNYSYFIFIKNKQHVIDKIKLAYDSGIYESNLNLESSKVIQKDLDDLQDIFDDMSEDTNCEVGHIRPYEVHAGDTCFNALIPNSKLIKNTHQYDEIKSVLKGTMAFVEIRRNNMDMVHLVFYIDLK